MGMLKTQTQHQKPVSTAGEEQGGVGEESTSTKYFSYNPKVNIKHQHETGH